MPDTTKTTVKDPNTLTLRFAIPSDATDETIDIIRTEAMKAIKLQAASAVMRPIHIECQIITEREVSPGEWCTEDDDSAIRNLPNRQVMQFVVPCEPLYIVAMLTDDAQKATEYALKRWPDKNLRVIALTDRMLLGRLYGHQGVPLVMVPGTQRLLWHRDVAFHARCGRVVPLPEETPSAALSPRVALG